MYKEYKVEKKKKKKHGTTAMTATEMVKMNYLLGQNKEIVIEWTNRKKLTGESTKGEFFFVIGERMSKFSSSVGLLLFSCYSRGNLAIWSQFGPRLQNLISHDSL